MALGSHEGAKEMLRDYLGQPWTQIERTVVEAHARDLIALSPEGLVHYLPAHLQFGFFDPSGEIATYTMYSLCPTGEYQRYSEDTCRLFTPEQARVIVEYLRKLESGGTFTMYGDEIRQGLALWNRRADEPV